MRVVPPASTCTRAISDVYGVIMDSVNHLLKLFMRQAQLERAMKQPGGARVTEERELNALRQRLAGCPEASKYIAEAQGNDGA